MENWNLNEWQGKRKDQVEFSSRVAVISLVLLVLILMFFGLYNLISQR